jgi:hypothetical protein
MSNTTDRINEENSKKIYDIAKEHSNIFELNNEYSQILEVVGKSQDSYSESHKDRILRLAKILDETNKIKKEKICSKVCKDLIPYGIKVRYVQKILPEEYKDQDKVRDQIWRPRAPNEQGEEQKDPPMKMTTDGQIVHDNNNPLDDIYVGKSYEQMKRENEITTTKQQMGEKIRKDEEEALENPQNNVPLISDISPEIREKLARFDEMQEMVTRMAEDRDHAVSKHSEILKKYNQLKGGSKDEELVRLKVENNNLNSILKDIDRQVLEQSEFKEVEVFKIQPGTIRLLTDISNRSQRTLFLLVNPKTQLIQGIKTDVDMHKIQAKRNAGVS